MAPMATREVLFDPSDAFVRPLIEAGARLTLDLLAEHGKTHTGLIQAVASAHAFSGEASRTLVERVPQVRRLPLACAPGCASCCHGTPVLVQASEALNLASHLRQSRSAEELSELADRIRLTLDQVRDMDQEERARSRIPCPLLDVERGACTAYEARPFACRAYNSCDRSHCEAALLAGEANPDLPSNPVLFRATHAVGFGLMTAAALQDLETGPYELVNALATALTVPGAEERWLAGEAVFSHTRVSAEGAEAYGEIVAGLTRDFRAGKMKEAIKLVARVDPDLRRRARNRRKAGKGR